jgi:NAD+ diphosphatase
MNKKLQVLRGIFNSRNYHLLGLTLTILLGIYKRYKPSVTSNPENNGPAYWFIFNDSKLLINPKNDNKLLFANDLNELSTSPIRTQYLGTLEGHSCYAVEVAPETTAPQGMAFEDLKSLYKVLDEDIFLLAGRAIQIINFDKNHQFCGKCGAPTENKKHEIAKICPECGFMSFTRLSPAVITAIIKDNKILMAKHS